MVSATAPLTVATMPSLDVTALSSVYTFKDCEYIEQFLTAHPLALTLLQEAPLHIKRLFGANTLVQLEINFDPEYPQQRELWALIAADMGTPEKVQEAEQNLRRLHDEWLIHLPRALSGAVHFDMEQG